MNDISKAIALVVSIAMIFGAVAIMTDDSSADVSDIMITGVEYPALDKSGVPVEGALEVTFENPVTALGATFIIEDAENKEVYRCTLDVDNSPDEILMGVTLAEGDYKISVGPNNEPFIAADSYSFTTVPSYKLTLTSVPGVEYTVNGDVTEAGEYTYKKGTAVSVEAKIIDGYTGEIAMSVNGDAAENPCSVTMDGDKTVDVSGVETIDYIISVEQEYSGARFVVTDVTDPENKTNIQFVDGKATVAEGHKLSVRITIDASYEGTPVITVNGLEQESTTFDLTVDSDITISVTGIYDPDNLRDMTVGGDSNTGITNLGPNQIVTVTGTWTLVPGAHITILGQLVVPEGCSIVISSNATLVIGDETTSYPTTKADIRGSLIIEDADEDVLLDNPWLDDKEPVSGQLTVYNGEMTVYGSANIAGKLDATGGDVTVKADASVAVDETGILTVASSDVVVEESATLTVSGKVSGAIKNAGTVVIDSDVAAEADTTVYMTAAGAVVDIQTYTSAGKKIIVTDEGLVLASDRNGELVAGKGANVNVVTITGAGDDENAYVYAAVSGITVTENEIASKATDATGDNIYNKKLYTSSMSVSGSAAVEAVFISPNEEDDVPDKMTASAEVALKDGSVVTVSGELIVGNAVTLVNNAKLTVSGTLSATVAKVTGTEAPVAGSIVSNKGSVEVVDAGHITLANGKIHDVENSKGTVDGTYYTVTVDGKTTHHYVTVDTALATVNAEGNAVKKLDVLGEKQKVTASATLPADVTMNIVSKLTVGEKAGSDVVLTIDADAKVTNGTVYVDGTLYAENFSKVKSEIIADVYSYATDDRGRQDTSGWAKWTNLTTALNEAKPGETVSVYKDAADGHIDISESLTIPADVTLYVGEGKAPLCLKDGVTLTVNGTLRTCADVYAQTMFGTSAMNVAAGDSTPAVKSSSVVVNGYLYMSTVYVGELAYKNSTPGTEVAMTAGAPIAGVYYDYDYEWSVVSTMENAIAVLDKVSSEALVVYGAVNAGDISFTATDVCKTVSVPTSGAVNDMSGNAVETALTVSSLVLSGSALEAVEKVSGTVTIGDASVVLKNAKSVKVDGSKLTVSGAVSGDSVTVFAGEVTAKVTNGGLKSFVVSEGAALVSDGASFNKLTVNGDAKMAEGKSLTAVDITVNGTLAVASNETLNVTGTAYIGGALTVAASTTTTSAGTATVANLMIGLDKDFGTLDGASVSGPVKVGTVAYVLSGASVDDVAQAVLDAMDSTEYYIDDAVWITGYGDALIDVVKNAPVTDAYFKGWVDADGATIADDAVIGTPDKVYASVETDVYYIIVLANEGIADVFIDGQLMAYGLVENDLGSGIQYAYTAMVAKGQHQITYTLKNGYDGTAILSVNGTQQSGTTFTASGTPTSEDVTSAGPGTIQYTLQLSGIEKSGYVDPVDPTPVQPSDDGDDGMTITDYLLIVLVVLIVIIAILVAVRLMRS